MQRRQFLTAAGLLSASAPFSTNMAATNNMATLQSTKPFNLHFAPHEGMFRHHAGENILDQIRFAADQGFTAWEDNGMPNRTPEEQKAIGNY